MQFGWTSDEKAAVAVMDAYIEAGGNFIDTADVYSRWAEDNPGGVSEEIIGRWMKDRGNRQDVVIATKVRGRMWDGPNGDGLSRVHILRAVEDSLRRLGTDYVDLYQTHSFDDRTPIDETLHALEDLVRSGKVRYIGASNYPAWRFMQSLWRAEVEGTPRFDSLQPNYSLVRRAEFERELMDVCDRYRIGVIPYSPLAGGFLTGKYSRDKVPESARAEGAQKLYYNESGWRALEALQEVAKEVEAPPAAVALAWLLEQPAISAPIVGANSVEQLEESLATSSVSLTPDQLLKLSASSEWREG
jgi:aryl-alcohol dehydrogenase-like predicted oxidoreductase